ncbi:MAG: two-component system response regulator [Deltaproteobacteria bacterium HGW-Deltaproteobacteria-23]|jgi:DNA-binding response OmpR family regulator|nr:MAG: two-component system response regulator [Deltaproteobacteria bacterium HGW-Deltaproteobacteria-23]
MSKKILVIDDSQLVLAMASDALQAAGFDVFTATNGIEANSFIFSTNNRPDLIILDIMMPLLDGNKKAKILKEKDFSKDIPILFISSKDEAELSKLAADSEVDGYICKPFTPQTIVNSVRKALKV